MRITSSSRDKGSAQSRVSHALLLLLTLTLTLAACHRPTLKPTVEPVQWSFGPASNVTDDDILDPDELFPLEPGVDNYIDLDKTPSAQGTSVPVSPSPSAQLLTMRLEHIPADPKAPFRRHTPDRRIEHLSYDAKGALVMHAVEDLDHQALTLYDPPLPVIPHNLKPNRPRIYTSTMTVLNRTDPTQQKDKGSCQLTITADATQLVTAPAGHFNCLRITSSYSAKLSLATVTSETQSWYAEDIGLIAEKSTETIKALFLSFNNQHTFLLHDTTPAPARPLLLP